MTIFKSAFPDVLLKEQTITERVFERLEITPDAPAVIDGSTGEILSSRSLVDRVKRLAGGLNARGLGEGKTIALMAPNIPEYCIIFHGVAWAGGTVTTINPSYTAAEVRHQLDDADADALVTTPMFLETAKAAIAQGRNVEIIVIGGAEGHVSLEHCMGASQAAQTPVDVMRHVVALPYSSGTTGLPKGVMLTHRNLVVNVDQMSAALRVEPGERTVVFLPFFHIYGMNALMNLYLSSGGVLVTMPRFDMEQFLALVAEHRTQKIWAAPPVVLALSQHPAVDDYDLSPVEMIFSAAAPLAEEVGIECGKRLGCVVTQGYGMTELSPASHVMSGAAVRSGTVGLTVSNTACRIVDPESGADLGVDQEGELWIKGPQVMLGYLNNQSATDTTIVEDGWLRTGDLACFDADGYLYIRDRLKELIKYKGFQVAPAELEAALLTHSDIVDAAVIGLPDPEAGELPVAFVVKAPNAEIGADAIKSHIAANLANYKHLHQVTFLEAIPKSASGKILRRVLRDQASA